MSENESLGNHGFDIKILRRVAVISIPTGKMSPSKSEEYVKKQASEFSSEELKKALDVDLLIYVPYRGE